MLRILTSDTRSRSNVKGTESKLKNMMFIILIITKEHSLLVFCTKQIKLKRSKRSTSSKFLLKLL